MRPPPRSCQCCAALPRGISNTAALVSVSARPRCARPAAAGCCYKRKTARKAERSSKADSVTRTVFSLQALGADAIREAVCDCSIRPCANRPAAGWLCWWLASQGRRRTACCSRSPQLGSD